MNNQVLHDCLHLALKGNLSFPETIQRMAAEDVERYRADLVRMEKTHYSNHDEAHLEPIPLAGAPAIAHNLDIPAVKEAISVIQQKQIDYAEFLRRIMAAGVADYSVWLRGRKAMYFGRTGDFHIENFPGK
ncbi:MAG TPA: DUF1398 family protein [Acidobacteriaceae bacterium]|jgi:uncharacterized protein YbcV (DUF1398 family)|nr:DUF1398 family protein [Acidobacteriaceae bacterium]